MNADTIYQNQSFDEKEEQNDDIEEQDRKHFCRIVTAFKSYSDILLTKIYEKEKYIKTFSMNQQGLLKKYTKHLSDQKECLAHNASIINLILKDVESMFENAEQDYDESVSREILSSDLEKVQSTLKQIVRDWSEEGADERRICYSPIIDKISALFPPSKCNPKEINILVPGGGLGRLAFELAQKGYTCQGNEFSFFMLFTSNFILNKLQKINEYSIYPYAHCGSNTWENKDQLKRVTFPDVDPSGLPDGSNFSMGGGDFLQIYDEENSWDVLATCFFIDCGNNVVSFIETIHKILKPGGYWVNFGPLLYHFADVPGENSIEPSYEILREIISNIGFKFLEEKTHIEARYSQNDQSMLKYDYNSVFFVVQKQGVEESQE